MTHDRSHDIKISILTPVYMGERYVEGCVENVARQQCGGLEHIIVDGGSSDRTVEIIRGLADKYPDVRWISEPDRGQSDALNKAIAMARGDIIGVLNVDDFYDPGVLPRIVSLFKDIPEPSLVVGACRMLGERDRLITINRPRRLRWTDLVSGSLYAPFPWNPSAYFYHRTLHDLVGLYDPDEHYLMDLDFILRAVRAAHVRYFDEWWGNFRFVAGGKTFGDMGSGGHHRRMRHFLRKHRATATHQERRIIARNQLYGALFYPTNKLWRYICSAYFRMNENLPDSR